MTAGGVTRSAPGKLYIAGEYAVVAALRDRLPGAAMTVRRPGGGVRVEGVAR